MKLNVPVVIAASLISEAVSWLFSKIKKAYATRQNGKSN
jgi:Flp pilus assembly pilin Flp